mgnify:CR=1 FL=1
MYKNNTETNLKIGEIKQCDTLTRIKIEHALKRAEIKVKRYNPEYWLSDNIKNEIITELLKELR